VTPRAAVSLPQQEDQPASAGGAQSAFSQAADLHMSQPPSVAPSRRSDCGPKIAAAVFFDPAKKRWPRLRLGMLLVGVALIVLRNKRRTETEAQLSARA